MKVEMRELATVSISSRRIGLLLFAFCCVCVFVFVVSAGYLLVINPFDDLAFDSGVWEKSGPVERAGMADDLVDNHLPRGTSDEDVRRLLGEPYKIYENEHVDGGGNALSGAYTFAYYVGSWSFAYRDSAFVYVHFSDERRVLLAEIQGY